MNLSSIKRKIVKISQNPGVYIFYGKNRHILYVGKATNLKSRVSSYFSLTSSPSPGGRGGILYSRPIEAMIHEVADIETKKTDSVLEALILESHLIKKLQPKYNAMGKDDKSFCYFVLTKEDFPRVLIMRETELNKTDANLRKNANLRTVNKKIQDTKYRIPDTNIFGPYTSKRQMEIALKIMRKIFPFHSLNQKTEKGCLDFQLGRCPGPYAGAISKKDYAKNIRGIKMILAGKKKSLMKKLEKEMKEAAKKHEFEKATDARNKLFALKHINDVALLSSSDELSDTRYAIRDLRIEAYDISNISGQYAVGSMAVFKNNEPEKSEYRKFKIKTVEGADDVGMMAEVLSRRFRNDWPASTRGNALSTRGWPKPDLILLDGGKGHLNMGLNVLKAFELDIPIAAVAKGKTRKNLKLITHNPKPILLKILNDKKLIKRIMDEAHRFAITYHKKVRKKSFCRR